MQRVVAKSSFTRLIKLYTAIISVMVVFATGTFAWSSVRSYESETRQGQGTAAAMINRTISNNQALAKQFASRVVNNPNNLTSLNRYFNDSIAEYATYAIDESLRTGNYFYWPTESRQFLVEHPEVAELTLQLTNNKLAFTASQSAPSGRIVKGPRVRLDAVNVPLINQYTLTPDGIVSMKFQMTDLTKQLRQVSGADTLQAFVLSDQGGTVFRFAGRNVDAEDHRYVGRVLEKAQSGRLGDYGVTQRDMADGYTLLLVTKKSAASLQLFTRVLPAGIMGLFVLIALSSGLWLLFRRYQQQLGAIVTTVEKVSAGDLDARVPVDSRHTDLKVLAEGINAMLVALHEHVYTIYQLRIAQQEATMKALQAQINPHFMSNTLEYIRMAALDADQPELAQVVYSFAALLRNNVDMSTMTTLKKELSFVEKYVFLYQVRFPDRLAYQIQVAPDVAEIPLPKFSLQPIIENYFVHGVDFRRQDNALSVKAWREAQTVHILVVNNGKPLNEAEIQAVNAHIHQPLADEQRQSIGLQNVYSRMKQYLGDSFEMQVTSDGQSGVMVRMQFQLKGGDEHAESHARG